MVRNSNKSFYAKRRAHEIRMAKEMTKQLRLNLEIKKTNLACIEKASETLLASDLTAGLKLEALDLFHKVIN